MRHTESRRTAAPPDTLPRAGPPPASALWQDGETQIFCYDNEVPPDAAAALDTLYQHLHCSLSYFRMRESAQGASTYAVRRGRQFLAVLLYRQRGTTLVVLNEMMTIDNRELLRFVQCMFERWPQLRKIAFPLIRVSTAGLARAPQLPYPMQQFDRYAQKKLAQALPAAHFEVWENAAVTPDTIRAIVALSRARIGGKGLAFGVDNKELDWMVRQAPLSGLVGAIMLDGTIIAGAINFRVSQRYFGHVLAHDPHYNDYSLGTICCYLMLCENIRRGASAAHMSWGEYSYKYRFMAMPQRLSNLTVYRSRICYLMHAHRIVFNALRIATERCKFGLLALERDSGDRLGGAHVARLIKALRGIKRKWWRDAN